MAAALLLMSSTCVQAQPAQVDNIRDVFAKLRTCWKPPPASRANPIDISGWQLSGDVSFTFPAGTTRDDLAKKAKQYPNQLLRVEYHSDGDWKFSTDNAFALFEIPKPPADAQGGAGCSSWTSPKPRCRSRRACACWRSSVFSLPQRQCPPGPRTRRRTIRTSRSI